MRKNMPKEPNLDEILNLLYSLGKGLRKAFQTQGAPIIVVTAIPAPCVKDNEDDEETDEDDYDEDDYDEDDYDEDDDEDCPDYEPYGDGTGRCAYSCPECGICLRDYIGEEFE